MGFFGDDKPKTHRTLEDCIPFVENFFRKVNLDPNQNRLKMDNGYGWSIKKGSATLYILLQKVQNDNTIRVASPILYLPAENLLPIYRRCLELNFNTLGCAFSINKNMIVVVSERPVTGLDNEEMENMMVQVSYVADTFDNKFIEEFGAKPIGP